MHPNEINNWIITDNKSHDILQTMLEVYDKKYAERLVMHVNSKGLYRISHFSILNKNSISEFAVNYHPLDENAKKEYRDVKHTRPASEFFDGRFIL